MDTLKTGAISLLRWSERYTKTDMVYLAHGGFWLVTGQAFTFVASFILAWAFANLLPKETYGQYRFIVTACAFLSIAALPGMGTAISRAVAQGATGTLMPALKKKIHWGALGTIGGYIAALYYLGIGNIQLALLFIAVAGLIPFFETYGEYQAYLQGKKDFRRQALYRTLHRYGLAATLILAMFFTSSILVLVIVFITATTLFNKILLGLTRRAHPDTGPIDEAAITYGIHLSFISSLRSVAQYLDKILLFSFVGPAQLAVYFFATALPQEIFGVFGHVNNLIFPKIVEKTSIDRKSFLRKLLPLILILSCVTAGYILTAPYIFAIFFPLYNDAIIYSQLMSLIILFVPNGILLQFFYARGKTKTLATFNIIEPLVLVVAYIVLIPLFGIYGVIFATLGKMAISAVLLVFFFMTHTDRPIQVPTVSA